MKINFDRATKRRYSIETVAPNRFYLTFAERNSRGEQITIGFTACKTHPERLINFDFMLPATEQSAAKILREVERRAFETYQRI